MLLEAERSLIVPGGGIINADASDLLVEFAEVTGVPVIPTLMGWGTIPDDHPLMAEHPVPVVLEFITERVTNIAMGTEIHNVNEFEEILCLDQSLAIDRVSGSVLNTGEEAPEGAA